MDGGIRDNRDELNFEPPHSTVLACFTPEAGESVAYVLIRELIDHVDRPSVSASSPLPRIQFGDDNQLQWIMQVVNHAFFLPMHNTRDYDTVRSAVRIYLAWLTGVATESHPACPKPLILDPIKYFR